MEANVIERLFPKAQHALCSFHVKKSMAAAIIRMTKYERDKYSVFKAFHIPETGGNRDCCLMDIRKLYAEEI